MTELTKRPRSRSYTPPVIKRDVVSAKMRDDDEPMQVFPSLETDDDSKQDEIDNYWNK